MALLDVQDLRTVFHTEGGVVRAVDGVTFSVEPGRTLGIVGESGCGKSVTAMSILRLVPSPPGHIAGGRVEWKGENLLGMPIRRMPDIRGNEIAMIFQDPMASLNPVFTIERQLGEVLKKRYGMKGEKARQRAAEVLEQVGIPDPEKQLRSYPHELSGGMKQRIMIAMALLAEPDLLIADEPTTALDVTIQAQILHLLKELQQRMGTAIILITHDMGVVAEVCDEVAVMYAGRIVEKCGINELFESSMHPYTRALLESIPKPGQNKEEGLRTIEGTVPSLARLPKGCRFAERCFKRQQDCVDQAPVLEEVRPGHWVECFHPLEEAEAETDKTTATADPPTPPS